MTDFDVILQQRQQGLCPDEAYLDSAVATRQVPCQQTNIASSPLQQEDRLAVLHRADARHSDRRARRGQDLFCDGAGIVPPASVATTSKGTACPTGLDLSPPIGGDLSCESIEVREIRLARAGVASGAQVSKFRQGVSPTYLKYLPKMPSPTSQQSRTSLSARTDARANGVGNNDGSRLRATSRRTAAGESHRYGVSLGLGNMEYGSSNSSSPGILESCPISAAGSNCPSSNGLPLQDVTPTSTSESLAADARTRLQRARSPSHISLRQTPPNDQASSSHAMSGCHPRSQEHSPAPSTSQRRSTTPKVLAVSSKGRQRSSQGKEGSEADTAQSGREGDSGKKEGEEHRDGGDRASSAGARGDEAKDEAKAQAMLHEVRHHYIHHYMLASPHMPRIYQQRLLRAHYLSALRLCRLAFHPLEC